MVDRIIEETLWPLFERHYLADNAPYKIDVNWLEEPPAGITDGLQALRQVQQTMFGGLWVDYRRRLMMRLYWPRIDTGPLRSDHALKVPFCVHQSSKRVSIPLAHPEQFLPSQSPTRVSVLEDPSQLHLPIRYMQEIVDASQRRPTRLRKTLFPVQTPYIVATDWVGKSAEAFAEGLCRAAAVLGFPLIVLPNQEWFCRVVVQGYATNLLRVASEEGPLPPSLSYIVSHGQEGHCDRYAPNALLVFDGAAGGVTVSQPDTMELVARRIQQFRLVPGSQYALTWRNQ